MLILSCVRWSLGWVDSSGIRAQAGSVTRWELFFESLCAHGCVPVATDCLTASGIALPESISSVLLQMRRQAARRSLVFSTALEGIAQCFAECGIDAMALKGTVIAGLYPDPSWRAFGDLDLLVRPADVSRALLALARLGYQSTEPPAVDAVRRVYSKSAFEVPLVHGETGVHLDLHWRVLPRGFPAQFPLDSLFGRSIAANDRGHCLRSPDPVDHLLLLSSHGAKHGWRSLDSIVDIHRLSQFIGEPGIAEARRRAPDHGAARMLEFALELSDALDASDTRRGRLPLLSAVGPPLENSLFIPCRLADSSAAALRYFAWRLFVPQRSDWVTLRLPSPHFYPLYYPWRLLRTSWRLLSRALL